MFVKVKVIPGHGESCLLPTQEIVVASQAIPSHFW